MEGYNFISPSIQFKETNLTSVVQNVGNTYLALVGEFQKGPAFSPTQIANKNVAFAMFGRQSSELISNVPKYPATFAMNNFLDESPNLTVMRVLGLSGYNAGEGWAIGLYGGTDIDSEVVGAVTGPFTYTGTTSFSGNTLPSEVGSVDDFYTTFDRVGNQYEGFLVLSGEVTSYNSTTAEVTFDYYLSPVTRQPLADYDNVVSCVIRPRARYNGEVLEYLCDGLVISGATGGISEEFTLVATNSATSYQETYIVSLDPTKRNYLPNVVGSEPFDKNSMVWVEKIYTDAISLMDDRELVFGVNPAIIGLEGSSFTNYNEGYRGAETPWVVSEIRGNKIYRLFKAFTISDGDSSNTDVKISIQNINPDTKEFDLVVRDYFDTDDRSNILESFSRCSMDESLPSYIGKRVGEADETMGNFKYDRKSNYIYIVTEPNKPMDAFPCGFEGYFTKDFSTANTGTLDAVSPKIFYKTSYSDTDRVGRTYLGISETVYRTSLARAKDRNGFNGDFFSYFGALTDANAYKTKGFHMDSDATLNYIDGSYTIGEFEVGESPFNDVSDVQDEANAYFNRATRKFTVLPYRGFDGWDIYRTSRTNADKYAFGRTAYFNGCDWDAYKTAIDMMGNTEETEFNILATPNLNWFDHLSLANECIELCERTRGDSLYVVDPPDFQGAGVASDLANAFSDTGIDSSYTATYAPWVEVNDEQSNRPIFLPPSARIGKAFALTDNRAFPWFATAGQNRGTVDARRTRKKLSQAERDVLYEANINAIADFKNEGPTIYGNKTTQLAENALNRINVRRLLLHAKKAISTIARALLFDPNDEVVRSQFETKVNALLSSIKRDRGLYDFKIVGDGMSPEVLDRNEMLYKLMLKPTRALEYIGIEFVVTPTGASFDDVTTNI